MSQGSLSISLPLLRWLQQGRHWQDLTLTQRATLGWKARWSTLNAALSRAQLKDAPALRAPLLIVGPWRSGTTVMHELLTAATGWPTPLTWQCMNASAFQLLGRPDNRPELVARPMDGLPIGALSPQEDEFALLTLGAPSAYRAFLQPDRLGELGATLEQRFWLDHSEAWLPAWEAFLQGVLATAPAAREHPLILKSPNHSFRLQAILGRFPAARLVWMARRPADVFESNRKMWRQMFGEHALRPDEGAGLDAFLTQAVQAAADTLAWLTGHVPREQWTIVDQDHLRADPAATVADVFERLALPGVPDGAALTSAIERTRGGKIDSYRGGLPAATEAALAALAEAQARALAR